MYNNKYNYDETASKSNNPYKDLKPGMKRFETDDGRFVANLIEVVGDTLVFENRTGIHYYIKAEKIKYLTDVCYIKPVVHGVT